MDNVIMGKMVLPREGMDKKVFLGLHVQVGDLDIWQGNQEDKEKPHKPKTMPLLNRSILKVQLWKET